jgi:peptidyl-tRNA hydrolase
VVADYVLRKMKPYEKKALEDAAHPVLRMLDQIAEGER